MKQALRLILRGALPCLTALLVLCGCWVSPAPVEGAPVGTIQDGVYQNPQWNLSFPCPKGYSLMSTEQIIAANLKLKQSASESSSQPEASDPYSAVLKETSQLVSSTQLEMVATNSAQGLQVKVSLVTLSSQKTSLSEYLDLMERSAKALGDVYRDYQSSRFQNELAGSSWITQKASWKIGEAESIAIQETQYLRQQGDQILILQSTYLQEDQAQAEQLFQLFTSLSS